MRDIWEALQAKRPLATTFENLLITALRDIRNMVSDKDKADKQIELHLGFWVYPDYDKIKE